MKARVLLHRQAEDFLRRLAPEPRGRVVRSIKSLPRGDIKQLEGRLVGYWRLRSGGYRVVYADGVREGIRTFDCVFIERRSLVYELFEQLLVEEALGAETDARA